MEVDKLAGEGKIEDVYIQTGFATFKPKYCDYRKAIDFYEFEQKMDKADLIISHGGAGCIAGALELKKPTILVPRLKKYNEHNNDHQLELVSVLEKAGRVLAVYDIRNLEKMIRKAWQFKPMSSKGKNIIVHTIRKFLSEIAEQKGLRI
jgi:UDP-N-acetylglucosamine transferase subunit ALG13